MTGTAICLSDAVLTEMASRITSHFRDSDIVSRIGGDEFIVFMPGIESMRLQWNGPGAADEVPSDHV